MGRRGPKPEPTALRLERGNPGHRAINRDEPELPPLVAKPPTGLKGAALAEWKRLAPDLVSRGVLTAGDLVVFTEYCRLVGDVDAYEKLVARVKRENAHQLGYASYLLKLRGQLKQYAAELGLTPSSRSGVKAAKVAEQPAAKQRRFFGAGGGA